MNFKIIYISSEKNSNIELLVNNYIKKIKHLADINNPYLFFDDIIQNHNLGIIINDEYKDKMTLLSNENNISVYRGIYNHYSRC